MSSTDSCGWFRGLRRKYAKRSADTRQPLSMQCACSPPQYRRRTQQMPGQAGPAGQSREVRGSVISGRAGNMVQAFMGLTKSYEENSGRSAKLRPEAICGCQSFVVGILFQL